MEYTVYRASESSPPDPTEVATCVCFVKPPDRSGDAHLPLLYHLRKHADGARIHIVGDVITIVYSDDVWMELHRRHDEEGEEYWIQSPCRKAPPPYGI